MTHPLFYIGIFAQIKVFARVSLVGVKKEVRTCMWFTLLFPSALSADV